MYGSSSIRTRFGKLNLAKLIRLNYVLDRLWSDRMAIISPLRALMIKGLSQDFTKTKQSARFRALWIFIARRTLQASQASAICSRYVSLRPSER